MLQKISSDKLLDGMPPLKNAQEKVICQGCQYGKSHRLPFKSSSNRVDESLTPSMESSSSENGQEMVRRSLREKRQPNHLKDYQLKLNHCTM
ncbi:hypothetical protein H5410_035632 [Solanum commersonii]|uniref:Uncharacterized protein n=1 Tax=Solanum commersonii TaxID=4109 RepID=A0A9J5Y4A2_SOLCO|nr:hypothetical protein H5410_035632 [Solanum commersonii]